MNIRRIALLAPALVVLGAAPAQGWDRLGHEVVARIAWEHMTETARRAAVEALLSAPADAGIAALLPDRPSSREAGTRILFQRAAYWPDMIRDSEHTGHRYDRPPWHYVNLFWSREDGSVAQLDRPPVGEAVHRLEFYRCALPDGARPGELGVHLAWLLHIAADLHQPLHASARVSRSEPDGDRGGNDFELDEEENLHAYWDGLLGEIVPRADDASLDRHGRRVARRLMTRHPPSELEERIAVMDPRAWARESFEIARSRLYPPDLRRGGDPPPGYREEAREIAGARAALAGYRIAAWLNAVFGSGSVGPGG